MMTFRNISLGFSLTVLVISLSANLAVSAGAPKKEEGPEREEGASYTLTAPTIRSPFPRDILEEMRKNLMAHMGIEPEPEPEPEKAQSSGH